MNWTLGFYSFMNTYQMATSVNDGAIKPRHRTHLSIPQVQPPRQGTLLTPSRPKTFSSVEYSTCIIILNDVIFCSQTFFDLWLFLNCPNRPADSSNSWLLACLLFTANTSGFYLYRSCLVSGAFVTKRGKDSPFQPRHVCPSLYYGLRTADRCSLLN